MAWTLKGTSASRRSWSCLYCGYSYTASKPQGDRRACCSNDCSEAMRAWVAAAPRLSDGGLPQVLADIPFIEIADRLVHNGGEGLPARYPTIGYLEAQMTV